MNASTLFRKHAATSALLLLVAACSGSPAVVATPTGTPVNVTPTVAPSSAPTVMITPAPAAACAAWACTFNEVKPLFETQFGLSFAAPTAPHIGVRADKEFDIRIAGAADSSPLTVFDIRTSESSTVNAETAFAIRLMEPANADAAIAWLASELTATQAYWAANPDCIDGTRKVSNGTTACVGMPAAKKTFGVTSFEFVAEGNLYDQLIAITSKAISLTMRPV